MKTLKSACKPRDTVFDAARRDTVLDLSDLVGDRIKPEEFFPENYITEGMKTLLTEGFRRLEGKSDQGVFKLTQAMGGGKTHNLLALGLLAKHPKFRVPVMGSFYTPDKALGSVRVVAFSGRESDAPYGIWGAMAEQLGKRELFKDYYSPLSAPGQTAWVNLLKGGPHQSGRDAVVVVSANKLGMFSRPRGSLVDFFRKSPLANVNLDLARSTDTGRRVDL